MAKQGDLDGDTKLADSEQGVQQAPVYSIYMGWDLGGQANTRGI